MPEPMVSVIVPTYNRAHCVTRAIDSALAQQRASVEIILVDDGSKDNTREVIASRYQNDPRVKYFAQENQGVTAARNFALSHASGDFIALLDSDDYWKPWKLSAQLACMARWPDLVMTWTDMEAVNSQGAVIDPRYIRRMYHCWSRFSLETMFSDHSPLAEVMPDSADPLKSATFHMGDVFSQMFMGSLVHTSTVMFRRSILDRIKGFDYRMKRSGEDYDFHLRTCREGRVGFLDVPSIQYQIGVEDQLSHSKYEVEGAHNCLLTITRAYEEDRQRIHLPPQVISGRFAAVHAWLGEALLNDGERRRSRAEFSKSLHYKSWQPRVYRLMSLTFLPKSLSERARATYRFMKKPHLALRALRHRPV